MAIEKINNGDSGLIAANKIYDNDIQASALNWTSQDAGKTYPTVRRFNGVLYGIIEGKTGGSITPDKDPTVWEVLGTKTDNEFNINSYNAISNSRIFDIIDAIGYTKQDGKDTPFNLGNLNNIGWIDNKGIVRDAGIGNYNKFSDFIRVDRGDIIKGYFYVTSLSNAVSLYKSSDPNSFVKGAAGSDKGNSDKTYIEFEVTEKGYIRIFSYMGDGKKPEISIVKKSGLHINDVEYLIDNSKKWRVKDNVKIKEFNDKLSFNKGWLNSYSGMEITESGRSLHFLYSKNFKVKKGDKFYYKLYGNNNNIAVAHYKGEYLNSFNKVLLRYPANRENSLIEGDIIIEEDGFIVVHYRYNEGSPLDDLYFLPKPIKEYFYYSDAQKLYDSIFFSEVGFMGRCKVFNSLSFGELFLEGSLPTDESPERTPQNLKFTFYDKGRIILRGSCKMAIQGNASATYPKKGYSLSLKNEEEGALKVKFPGMVETDSFHLKAHYTDRTHLRDVSCLRYWAELIKNLDYPSNKFNNLPTFKGREVPEDLAFIGEAQYFTNGFPISLYLNNQFIGLYTFRQKKTRENYALDKNNKDNIFLDSRTYTAFLGAPFKPSDWEVKSPKMKGYEEGGNIPESFNTVKNNIDRLFNFLMNIDKTKQEEFINLPHWLIYVIFCEVTGYWDTNGNNVNLLTWDAIRWSIFPYDFDQVLGLSNEKVTLTQEGFMMAGGFWGKFRKNYKDELSKLYTDLRRSGMIDVKYIYLFFKNYASNIPRSVYVEDLKVWPDTYHTILPILEHIPEYLNSRIKYLDTQWLNK